MAIPNLKRLLADMRNVEDVDRAVRAAQELSRQATAEDVPLLRRILRRGDYFFRECLGDTLAGLEGPPSLPFLLELLREGHAEGHDHDGLAHAVSSLARMHPAEVAPMLLRWFNDRDPQKRVDAAWLAGFAASAVPLEPVLKATRDRSPRVRAAAVGSLTEYRGQDGVYERLVELTDDRSEIVVSAAVSSLGYLGDRRAVPLLNRLVRERLRCAGTARYALQQLRGK